MIFVRMDCIVYGMEYELSHWLFGYSALFFFYLMLHMVVGHSPVNLFV